MLAVIATYYVLFAVMSGSTHTLIVECAIVTLFLLTAVIGFRTSLWLVVAGLAGHGVFDFVHRQLVVNPGVPDWWPAFCLSYDGVAAAVLAFLLKDSSLDARAKVPPTETQLELRIPPVLVCAFVAGLMWFAAEVSAPWTLHFPFRAPVARGLALAGLAIASAGVFSFRRAKTTLNPTLPGSASSLVVSGIYRFTRNPMYLGLLLTLLGWGVYLGNVLAIALIPGFVIYMNRFQIQSEERALTSLFPQDFPAYKAKVRRWL